MNSKAHFAIIIALVIGMLAAWQIMLNRANVPTPAASDTIAERYISIVRANYGLNCLTDNNDAQPYPATPSETRVFRENNILIPASNACNGRIKCSIDGKTLLSGADSASKCKAKAIEIEYRCFSYDRLWTARNPGGNGVIIDCTEKK